MGYSQSDSYVGTIDVCWTSQQRGDLFPLLLCLVLLLLNKVSVYNKRCLMEIRECFREKERNVSVFKMEIDFHAEKMGEFYKEKVSLHRP